MRRDPLAEVQISLPPFAEQQRIAAILGEQMAAVEQARTAAQAQLTAARELPAAYLREVFDGDEARRWPKRRLGNIAILIQNGIYKPADYYGHGSPFLRMYNIRNDSWKLDLTTLAQVEVTGVEEDRYALEQDDLLVSRVNSYELVGKCGYVGAEAEGYLFENMLIRLRLGPTVHPLFISQQLNSPNIRRQLQSLAKKAIGQASINSKDLKDLELVVPALEDQRRLASSLDEKVSASRSTRAALQAQLDVIDQLPATLLRRAFSGEL